MASSSSGPGRPATEASPRWPRREAGPILLDPAASAQRYRLFPPRKFGCGLNHTSLDEAVGRAHRGSNHRFGNWWFKPHLDARTLSAGSAVLVLPVRTGGALWSAQCTAGGARLKDARCPQNASHFGSPTRRLRRSASPILDPVSTDAWRAFVHSRRRRFS